MDKVWLVIYAVVASVIWEAQAPTLHCPPGHALNSSRNGCVECGTDQYMDKFNSEQSCVECTVCTGLEMTVSRCNSTINTVCKCPPNHRKHADGCTPIVGASIADNCSLLLYKIEKSVDALRQSLNGTAEKALLGAVLNEVRMVKNNLASVSREANRTSSPRNEIVAMVSELTHGSPTAQGLIIAILFIVGIHLMCMGIILLLQFKNDKSTSGQKTERKPEMGSEEVAPFLAENTLGSGDGGSADSCIMRLLKGSITWKTKTLVENLEKRFNTVFEGKENPTAVAASVQNLAKRFNTAVYGTEVEPDAETQENGIMQLLKGLANVKTNAPDNDLAKHLNKAVYGTENPTEDDFRKNIMMLLNDLATNVAALSEDLKIVKMSVCNNEQASEATKEAGAQLTVVIGPSKEPETLI